jgi:predicted ester cyclase
LTTEQNKKLTRRMWEAMWNERALERYVEFFTPDSVLHVMGEDKAGETMGDALRDIWFASFPDIRVAIEDQLAEGDRVCDRLVFFGTHTGAPYVGIAAGGKPFAFTETVISRIEAGRIAEAWSDLDFFNFVRQLGAVIKRPEPVGA